ncbi:MAG: 16S rRNA (cytosine(1402)-N(4))-methyltransferase RsmH [Patescibacteria group bacterium]
MRHVPVLLNETIDLLNLKPGDNVIDCTLGDAGHSEAMLEKISPNGKLLGIDADPESVLRAKQYLYRFGERVNFVRDNFLNLKQIAVKEGFDQPNAILMDLGWSAPQFAERGRGFSFEGDESLNMRYSGEQLPEAGDRTAEQIVNDYSEDDLGKVFKQYGEEKFSQEIAEAIVDARKLGKILKTKQLTEIILKVYRDKLHSDKEVPWIGGLHPATKVFQALRIETNRELEVLKKVLPDAIDLLAPGGRLAVITFHSLEDRIVKHFYQSKLSQLKIITKKSVVAGEEELKNNPRARSARLRAVEKL